MRGLVPEHVWKRRPKQVREFERTLSDEGTAIVKVFLHVSADAQRQRLEERLADPEKAWKFSREDLVDRARRSDYLEVYEEVISETSTDWAPWYIVPADHNWIRNLAVAELLAHTLHELDPQLPPADPALAELQHPVSASSLTYRERPARGDAEGLLVLHHGRGSDEHDLLSLGDALDRRAPPARRHAARAADASRAGPVTTGTSCRASAIPIPTPSTRPTARLAEFHEELWAETGIAPARTVLGGFSMGSVMSYSLGLGPDRPVPAGILAFSGFVPVVEGWEPDLAGRQGLPVFIAHGRNDPIMDVGFARTARELLEAGGLDVSYHESDVAHQIDPAHLPAAIEWLGAALA